MTHLPHLITDLGLILGVAAVTTFVFKRLKQPIVLGYIIAGFFAGPYFSFFPSITDSHSVEVWAQIGVIILLFSLGLEFSFKKLIKVGGSAGISAITEITVMVIAGFVIGSAFGWSSTDSIFLGGILSISSTTIIIRAFDELGMKGKKFTELVIGILVIQDIAAIIMLVLLPTLAVSKEFSGLSVLLPVLKLGFFLILWFVSGIYFLPTVLRRSEKFLNDEMLLITSLALCFLMVILATAAGFSPALGAFIMGSILAETRVGGKIEHLTKPVKELFGAVFFISVGMMIDPGALPMYWVPILAITVGIIVLQPLSAITGALLAGEPLKVSVQTGMSLSQIGEFSFIIATLGLSLKVTSPFLYPIAVAASAITTFTTPYMIRLSVPLHSWLELHLPQKFQKRLLEHSAGAQTIKAVSDWKIFSMAFFIQTTIYSVIILGIILLTVRFVVPMWHSNDSYFVDILITIVTLLVISPFLWALTIRKIKPDVSIRIWRNNQYRGLLVALEAVRIAVGFVLTGFLIHSLLSFTVALAGLGTLLFIALFNYKRLQTAYEYIEKRFMANFNDKEAEEHKQKGNHLVPWDAHITSFTLSADYTGVGKMLKELQYRESCGVNIGMIKRGNFTIHVPDRNERIYPGDELFVIGTDEQIGSFKKLLEEHSKVKVNYKTAEQDILLQQVQIREGSDLHNKTIKESAIRERTRGLIVGIERGDERILNPDSGFEMQNGDKLWIVGPQMRIQALVRKGLIG